MGGSFAITLEIREYRVQFRRENICRPDEECGGDQHHGEVHSHGGLEVERLKVGGGVADTEEEEGGKVGGQQFIGNSSFELYLHFYALDRTYFYVLYQLEYI